MVGSAREQLAAVLRDVRSGGSFATRRTAPIGDLAVEVTGVGELLLPLTAAQAKELRLVSRPAKYGHGERTILDRKVRDTWEVPRSRVKIDKRRWNCTLRPLLETVRADFGLPPGNALDAELHSMLLYEPGQFFAPHQDSEKSDAMIGSLIVILPSRSDGGDLVITHRGESVRYKGSASSLTFVAFYADTRHEVLPLERGYRLVLTYNLMLGRDPGDTAPVSGGRGDLVANAAVLLTRHFADNPEPRWRGDREAAEPPDRLVFLLDHHYTERGLRWSQLKGDDIARGDLLHRAANLASCEVALARAEIHETYECFEDRPLRRHRRWSDWDDEDEDDDNERDDADADSLSLGELLESAVAIAPVANERAAFDGVVTSAELCAATPTVELTPYDTEYTGYMGNWGNTMDRWYKRAAIVVWPRDRAFAVRAKADPLGALNDLLVSPVWNADASQRPRPLDDVSTLLRFWPDAVRCGDPMALLAPALRLALQVDDQVVAARILDPFVIESVVPGDASVLVALAGQYGTGWLDRQMNLWMDHRRPYGNTNPTRTTWLESLPELVTNLVDNKGRSHNPGTDGTTGTSIVRNLVNRVGEWLKQALRQAAATATPSTRETELRSLGLPVLAVLQAAAIADDPRLRDSIIETACDPALRAIPTLVSVIDAASGLADDPGYETGVLTIARRCAETIESDLAQPERAGDDWSITEIQDGSCCGDCTTLVAFLTHPVQRQLIWPLAKPRRQHIHQRIDQAELPMTHRTVREGSPHKLVLIKTTALHERDHERRQGAQASLTVLRRLLAGSTS